MTPVDANVRVQVVMARGEVKPTPLNPTATDPAPGVALMSVAVSGDPVTKDGQPAQMPFLGRAPDQPVFLADITDQELEESGNVKRTFTFNSKGLSLSTSTRLTTASSTTNAQSVNTLTLCPSR
jgi:hypothetical protein